MTNQELTAAAEMLLYTLHMTGQLQDVRARLHSASVLLREALITCPIADVSATAEVVLRAFGFRMLADAEYLAAAVETAESVRVQMGGPSI